VSACHNPFGEAVLNRFPAAVFVAAGGHDEVALGDARVKILAGAAETGGAVALLDYRMPGHYQGPPAHVHPGFDEIFHVIEGTLTVRHGEEIQTAESGGTLVVPGTVPHAFANLAAAPARVMLAIMPAGFESYFDQIAPLFASGAPDRDAMRALAERYGVENVGPPLG
jgi:mannose-6-phosphate isomerase-like protein (cupin superfamily)